MVGIITDRVMSLGLSEEIDPSFDDIDVEFRDMESTEIMTAFWKFATTVRRTRSLAARESQRIRGEWLTPDLAIQCVHGWGPRAVRLLCIVAEDDDSRERYRFFFERDARNLDGRLSKDPDPLDREKNRVLVKIPYQRNSNYWTRHEYRCLTALAGIENIPVLRRSIFFEDVGVFALVSVYSGAQSLQARLEGGNIIPPEGALQLASLVLKTFIAAQARGWLHTDLRPGDILLKSEKNVTVSSKSAPTVEHIPLICGWAHACILSTHVPFDEPGALLAFVRQVPVCNGRPPSVDKDDAADSKKSDGVEISGGPKVACQPGDDESNGEFVSEETTSLALNDENIVGALTMSKAAPPSIYSAPEQFVEPFVASGAACEPTCCAPSTDVYRAAAVVLMALQVRGPLGVFGNGCVGVASNDDSSRCSAERAVTVLRQLGRECLLRRGASTEIEPGKASWLPSEVQRTRFAACFQRLLTLQPEIGSKVERELVPWFQSCLAKDPASRPATPEKALEALDSAWSVYEVRMLRESQALSELKNVHHGEGSRCGSVGSRHSSQTRPRRVHLEPPPELADMHVL
eukprot:TRINITY_DN29147_c0_g1_i1.p1 TRINITY_DN29147_c0_g1~~TRINITY_DN29147_c0_g1_i1.p1  ORF type:complete len:575 (+),score=95.15 TRINITY_DN29147_c0_g1_i1:203-1927(+)